MPRFSNPSLLNVQALFIDNSDSHAQHGAHVRVSHHPLLGLPTMPFVLQRADIDQRNFKRLPKRRDAFYHNQHNEPLIPPFRINLGDEITVTIPPGNTAIWAELIADPSSLSRPRDRIFSSSLSNRNNINRNIGRFNSSVDLFSRNLGNLRGDIIADLDLSAVQPQASSIKVTAYLQTVSDNQEYALLGSRNKPPFAFSGTGIKKLIVRGRGTIAGIQWLNADEEKDFFKFVTVDVLNLPHGGGTRYTELSNWKSLCDTRRNKQSPKRLPLQDTLQAPARFAAPHFSQAKENARVKTLFKGVEGPLDNLINQPTPQLLQEIHQDLVDENGNNLSEDGSGTMRIKSLGLVLQSQLDPGVASYLGYKTLDTARIKSNSDVAQRLSVYRIIGFFNDPGISLDNPKFDDVFESSGFELLYKQASALGSHVSTTQAMKQFDALSGSYLKSKKISVNHTDKEKNSFILQGIAVADHMSVLDNIEPVSLKKPCHLDWLPSQTNHPRRSVETELSDLVATAGLAVKLRQSKSSNNWYNKNTSIGEVSDKWHALTIAGIYKLDPNDRSAACQKIKEITTQEMQENFIADTSVGADDFRQYVAQMDRFGRYSEWANVVGDKGPRPKPPRPTVVASYRQPDTETGSHQGKVTATVPLPDNSALAPASFPLSHVELTVYLENAIFGPLLTIPVVNRISIHPDGPCVPEDDHFHPDGPPCVPEDDQFGLRVTFLGPIIPATLSRNLKIEAVWIDTQGQRSATSEPAKLIMHDPYPPEQISVPDVLEYAARPDATKKAWVERHWPSAASNVQYAVYYADENRLRDYLRPASPDDDVLADDVLPDAIWAANLLEDLENETDLATRATILKAENSRFPDYLYERLKDVVETGVTPNTTGFRHALSGSLRVLSAYKIVAEAVNTAARPDLSTVDVVFYGVPNSDPLVRPSITAKLVTPIDDEPEYVVELKVTLPAGITQGQMARIRRTRSGVVDPLTNPIVDTKNFTIDQDTGLQTAVFRDTGSALIAPNAQFSPFVNYAWIAEAQGKAEPGSASSIAGAVAGLWSRPSAPTNLDLIPQSVPEAPTFEQQIGNRKISGIQNLALEFSYPVNLVPTSLGAWSIRVEKTLPGEAMTLLSEENAETGVTFRVQGDMTDPSLLVPYGTEYRVRIIDPIGRESSAVKYIVS